ncbi:MAG: hypothetical protein ACMXYB_02690 [Candidatus Woesearchaeota archaeon]
MVSNIKKDLSNIQPSKTGVTQNFVNEFAGAIQFVELYTYDKITFETFINEILQLKEYQERYPLNKFDNVITHENSELIEQPNSIIKSINSILENMKSPRYHNDEIKLKKEIERIKELAHLGVRLIRGN